MLIKKNIRGEKLISVYWFLVLTIVAGGIFLMVNSFYGTPYDARKIEADLLTNQVARCLFYGNSLNPLFVHSNNIPKESFEDNFMKICSLNFDIKNAWDNPEFFVKLSLYENKNSPKPILEFRKGNLNYESDCFSNTSYNEFAQCSMKEFYAKSTEGKVFFVKIMSAVGKVNENVK